MTTVRTKNVGGPSAKAGRVLSVVALLAACGACVPAARGAVVNVQWINLSPLPADTWGVAANWNPVVVPDNGVDTYNVFIDLDGAYNVVLDQNRTITDLNFTAAGAQLRLFDGGVNTLTVLGNYTQGADTALYGDFDGATAQSSMSVAGNTEFQGGDVRFITLFDAQGDLHFNAASKPIGIGDCSVVHSGTTGQWSGGSDIQLNSGASLTFGATSVFTINATGNITQMGSASGAASIINNGTIVKASAGMNTIGDTDISLSNGAGAVMNVANGTLATDGQFTNTGTLRVSDAAATFSVNNAGQFTNFAGNTLTGGTLDLKGTLKFSGANVVNVASNVTLDGASAKITDETAQDGLRNAANVDSGGKLLIKNGADFTVGTSVPAFSVNNGGEFNVGTGSKLTIPATKTFTAQAGSTFTNIAATTTGGEIVVQGTLKTQTAAISTVGSKLTLDGASAQVTNASDQNALANVSTINATGFLTVVNKPSFITNTPTFNVQTGGHLTVGSGVDFDIPAGTLGNLTSATLDLGQFTLRGRVRTNLPAPGSIPALTLNNTTTLDGALASIFDITTNFDLFSRLSVIDTGGDLSLLNGRALSLTQPLTVRGRLFIGNTGAPRPGPGGGERGAGTEEVLQVTGDVTQERGFSAFDSGRLRIVGAGNAFKVLAGGLGGSGIVEGATWLGGNLTGDTAVISPGAEGHCNFGVLTITDNLRLREGSGFEFDIGTDVGMTVRDEVNVLGNTTIDSGVTPHIEFRLCDDFEPTLGQMIPVANLNVSSLITFTYGGLVQPNGITIVPVWSSGDLSVVVTAVPGPGAAGLVGVVGLLGVRRRR